MAGVALDLEHELAGLSRSFESAPASKIVRWAVDRFHPRLCLLSSMTDAVLIDLAVRVEPSIEVVFIDTGHHFPETLETVDLVRRRYGLNLRMVTVGPEPAPLGADGCCSATKVLQLDRALVGRAAWMSGLRRTDAPSRAQAPIVGLDRRGLVKVNPLAAWTDDDVATSPSTRSLSTRWSSGATCRWAAGRAPSRSPTVPTAGPGAGRDRRAASAACTAESVEAEE